MWGIIRYLRFVDFSNSFFASRTFVWNISEQSSTYLPLEEYFIFLFLNRVLPSLMTVRV